MSIRRALFNFFVWVVVAMAIDLGILIWAGPTPAAEFFGAFFMEEALSLDNLFMFFVVFRTFKTPEAARPRVLYWGIVGVILMRGLIILGGTMLIASFRPLLWAFALFLFWSAYKIFFLSSEDEELSPEERQKELERNWLVRLTSRYFGFDPRYHGTHFVTTVDGKTKGTMLLLTLLVIEGTDLPFAFDSLPAAMAVSQNFWIVIVSNILAVLGLRSIYFVIESMQERFSHMKHGIGLLLGLAAIKILLPDLGLLVNGTVGVVYPEISQTVPKAYGIYIPLVFSAGLIVGVIAATVGYTLLKTRSAAATLARDVDDPDTTD